MKYRTYILAFWRKHIRRRWRKYRWAFILGLWIISFTLGYIGASMQLAALGEFKSRWDPLFRAFQLFTMEETIILSARLPLPWQLEVARFLSPLLTFYAAISAIAIIFREKLRLLFLKFIHDHVVICGLGRRGFLLAKGFHEQGDRVVVIEKDRNTDFIEFCNDEGIMVFTGEAADMEMLKKVRVRKARHVISVCGDDGVNAEVAVLCSEIATTLKKRTLACIVNISDPALWSLFRVQEIGAENAESFRLEFFNLFDSGAKALLDRFPAFRRREESSGPCPHILLVGLGKMGESILVNAGRVWHGLYRKTGKRLPVTIIDRAAKDKIESLRLRYPAIGNACELHAMPMDVNSPEFQEAKFLYSEGKCDISIAYICLGNDYLGLSTGLSLLQRIRKERVPIVVTMEHGTGLAKLIEEAKGSGYDDLHAFGLLDLACTPGELLCCTNEVLARALHEGHVRFKEEQGINPGEDPAMVSWLALPEHLKESNRHAADYIGVKLRAVRCWVAPLTDWDADLFEFTPEEVETLARMEHKRWVKERQEAGWKFGLIRDVEKRTSPYLIPWEGLTEDVREYDRNATRILPSSLAMAGFMIYRSKE